MKKVIIIGKIPPPFIGTSVWFDILRNSDLKNDFDIHWFNVNIHNDVSTFGKKSLSGVIRNLRLYIKFIRTLHNFKPELILVPISQSTIGFLKDSAFILLAAPQAKIVIMLHGSNLTNWLRSSSFMMNLYFTRTMKRVSAAIVLGENLKYIFYPWLKEEDIFVVPNGINILKPNYKKNNRNKIILRYVGSLMPSKGVSELLEAASIVKSRGKDFILLINGSWRSKEYQKYCMDLISGRSIPAFYEGEVRGEQKISAFEETDIFVFTPTSPEGHPMVIIEAMASCLPVVTCDQGAIIESIENGINGFIVNGNHPEEIAEKIIYLIDNPEVRKTMGKESRRIYEERYTEEKMTNRLSRVINKIIENKSK